MRGRGQGQLRLEQTRGQRQLCVTHLVVLVDLGDRLHTGVLGAGVVAVRLVLLVPVEDAADERRDEGHLGLGARDGLLEAEQEGEVAVDALLLEGARGLDALPRRGDLDEDALLGDADLLVELDEVLGLGGRCGNRVSCVQAGLPRKERTHLGLGALGVEREGRVDLGRDAAGNNVEDLLAELDEL